MTASPWILGCMYANCKDGKNENNIENEMMEYINQLRVQVHGTVRMGLTCDKNRWAWSVVRGSWSLFTTSLLPWKPGYRYQHSISSKCPIFQTFAFFSVSIYKLDLKLPWMVSPCYQQHTHMYRSPYLQMVAEFWQNAIKHASQQGTTPHNTHREASD